MTAFVQGLALEIGERLAQQTSEQSCDLRYYSCNISTVVAVAFFPCVLKSSLDCYMHMRQNRNT